MKMHEYLSRLLEQLSDKLHMLWTRLGGASGAEEPEPVYALPRPDHADKLTIPVCEAAADETAQREAQARGQFLARQERWDDLIDEIRNADKARAATPGGAPIAELLAFGARSDVVLAAEHALQEGKPAADAPLLTGIKALETVRRESPADPYLSLIVALAHLDLGWAWRGTGWDAALPQLNRNRCIAHFDRARDLLAPYDGVDLDSPLIASAHCALLAGRRDARSRVSGDYEALIDLDPNNPRHMRALGYHLLPRWFGSYDELELQARRTAARTQAIWGSGGYTWVCFDAIGIDEDACAKVDVGFFIEGLKDIAMARPEQEMINLLAAYCAVVIRQGLGASTEADLARLQIADCAYWLVREHLTEVHPMVWAHALDGFDNNIRVSSVNRFAARGRRSALQAIGDLFREEIAQGCHVTFTAEGPRLDPA